MPQPVKSPTREQIRGAFEWTARYHSGGAHIGEPDLSDRAAEVLGDRCYTLLADGARDWQQRNGGPLNRPRGLVENYCPYCGYYQGLEETERETALREAGRE